MSHFSGKEIQKGIETAIRSIDRTVCKDPFIRLSQKLPRPIQHQSNIKDWLCGSFRGIHMKARDHSTASHRKDMTDDASGRFLTDGWHRLVMESLAAD
jgi:hypothetical protein